MNIVAKASGLKPAKKKSVRNAIVDNILSQSYILRQTVILIDYKAQRLICRNYNPSLKSIFEDEEMDMPMEKGFLWKNLSNEESTLYKRILLIMSEYRKNNSRSGHIYYFTFNVALQTHTHTGSIQMIQFKAVPLFHINVYPNKVPCFTYSLLEPSSTLYSGNLTLHDFTNQKKYYYLLLEKGNKESFVVLEESELSIFQLVAKGYVESEIAEMLKISFGTLKYLKSKILLLANVQSTTQLIALLTRQGFI
jgi:Response regulator containing a CheY-like receiver domain and an HTH DNA-binding domain